MLILLLIYSIPIVYFIQDSFVNLVHIIMVNEEFFSKIGLVLLFVSVGNYIKDLSRLGRDIRRVIIIDNSPLSYLFHQDNAVCDQY